MEEKDKDNQNMLKSNKKSSIKTMPRQSFLPAKLTKIRSTNTMLAMMWGNKPSHTLLLNTQYDKMSVELGNS